ncbi:hypothetical protein LO772_02065 [Yinghuangia sp. ASG 101]|uniref:DUF6059 family protein n=1 Tax=Yinghuangia sp. ASG 101 TaxID=2896848 RepID=UPI001E2A5778|nr:DUF6059 family protein [Yinghuangia sp. ASG 101]UGQ12423.1 hypothetical protein LO772_02065 [Yinghuangia sp. ASG 101]
MDETAGRGGGVLRGAVCRVARRVARWIGRMFVTTGMTYIYAYYVPTVTTGPAPAHPERLCPEVPLDDVERALAEQLGPLPRGVL